MNIAVVKESLCLGGTERSASNISRVLAEKYSVFTVLYDENSVEYPYGGELIGLGAPPRKSIVGKVINSFVRSVRLKKIIKEKKIDIVFTFTSVSGYLMHERLKNCRKVISCRDFGKLKRDTSSFALALDKADAIVFNSQYQRDFFVSKYPDMLPKTFVSYNVIDVEKIEAEAKEPICEEHLEFMKRHMTNIVAVGRFCKEKGFEHLLKAFERVHSTEPTIGLIIVGDGDLRCDYEKYIEQHDLTDSVMLTGFQVNPYKYINQCDMFVLSSVSEGFPNVVPEAMACGVPVICTNCLTGPAEILNRKYDYQQVKEKYVVCDYGILTPCIGESAEAEKQFIVEMSDAIIRLMTDKPLYERLKAAAIDRVRDFSRETAMRDVEAVIRFLGE